MKNKTIQQIIPAQKVNMGGHLLDQPLPIGQIDYIDPFLLIHHWKSEMRGGQKPQDVGVGPHPHRGFSPVTFVYKGNVQHRDSLGNNETVFEGGTQWMHAGKGITHSERPNADIADKGGELEFIQFWVNSPSKHKMDTASYLPLSKEETPSINENGVEVSVVAGEYKGIKGPAPTLSPMTLLRGNFEAGGEHTFNINEQYNTILYLLDGRLEIDNQIVKEKDMVIFNNDGQFFNAKALESTRFMLLSGRPLNEKVNSYGPFVMNSSTEILQALRDAQMGKMGVLIEEF